MFEKYMPSKSALVVLVLCGAACATSRGLPGESIEASTGKRTGNPFEIRLTAKGPELKSVLVVSRNAIEKWVLHDAHLQASTLELVSSAGTAHKPYDSRRIMKHDATPYCSLFRPVAPATTLELGTVRFRKSRDGYAGQWGPFNFDELPAGEYRARVIWDSERAQCLDDGTRQMRKLPSVWRGLVRSNQVTLRLQ